MGLELRSISSGYGETQVLWSIDMNCVDGSLTVIVGPNGAGKTTLLKVANGLIEAWRGSIWLDGRNITELPGYARVELGMASSPEGRRLFPDLTVTENLKLGSYTPRARKATESSLEFVYNLFPKLKERMKVKAGRLSGGEQQMLSLARALMAKPSLLILDEPSLGLAPKLVGDIFDRVRELKDQGLTTLMVEQNAYQAFRIADFAYVLQTGRIVNSGTPSELMNVEELRKAYFSIS